MDTERDWTESDAEYRIYYLLLIFGQLSLSKLYRNITENTDQGLNSLALWPISWNSFLIINFI